MTMSNRDRIARAAAEAQATVAAKSAKKPAKGHAGSGSKRAPDAVRMKIVWEVHGSTGKPVKTFPYVEKAQAEAETLRLTRSTGRAHVLQATKVPME